MKEQWLFCYWFPQLCKQMSPSLSSRNIFFFFSQTKFRCVMHMSIATGPNEQGWWLFLVSSSSSFFSSHDSQACVWEGVNRNYGDGEGKSKLCLGHIETTNITFSFKEEHNSFSLDVLTVNCWFPKSFSVFIFFSPEKEELQTMANAF